MHRITILRGKGEEVLYAADKEILSAVLLREGIMVEHPCGGRGACKKCTLSVNGEYTLSCQYKIEGDITVKIPEGGSIATAAAGSETERLTKSMCLCLDLGTTTLVLSLVSTDTGEIIKTITKNNPQRIFGADVMSRIDYCSKNGVEELNRVLLDELCTMTDELLAFAGLKHIGLLYVAGNTTMLHLFFGISCASMGYAPYEPVFLSSKNMPAAELGIKNVDRVISIEGISAFVGADIVSGLGYVPLPSAGKYNLLMDLGTNAELALYSRDKLYCTSAAAGPCFEGVNISCGMSATEGAIYSYNGQDYFTIGNASPRGLCATGLIDSIAVLLKNGAIDETGFMPSGELEICKGVSLTQKDVRQFQLAKGAICAAVITLLKKAQVNPEDIESAFISGGFSAEMNMTNALITGLFPDFLDGKAQGVQNSCLQGLVKYACKKTDLPIFLKNALYVDLSADEAFQELFIEKLSF